MLLSKASGIIGGAMPSTGRLSTALTGCQRGKKDPQANWKLRAWLMQSTPRLPRVAKNHPQQLTSSELLRFLLATTEHCTAGNDSAPEDFPLYSSMSAIWLQLGPRRLVECTTYATNDSNRRRRNTLLANYTKHSLQGTATLKSNPSCPRNNLPMDPNWPSMRSSDDHVNVSGSMPNTHLNNSGILDASSYGGNELDPELVPCTQPWFGNTSQMFSSASNHSVPRLDMPNAGLYPDIFPSPAESVFGGTDYGWYPNNSLQQANHLEGLESAQSTGMISGGHSGTAFNAMGLANNNNAHHPTMSLSRSSFNSNAQPVDDINSIVAINTQINGYGQALSFYHGSSFDPALTIPTSAMPNSMSIPAIAPAFPPLTTTETNLTSATPTTVADYRSNYGTPVSDYPEPETSTNAGKSKGSQKRVYRTSYDNHASHRYTCHPCRFSTDVKRDFTRHRDTDKHKKKALPQVTEQEDEVQEQQVEIQHIRAERQEGDNYGRRTRRMR
ncbi:hypothetical protein B0T20DRAFT_389290 [Sordaria brevicollis]|uniref:Uncharacterized protein n=1 Tax=Sordaria brevicollis TaxID=83679 RepID=A0AAE0PK18_SORBR|nr:hypothetical protein B0T20DRAFT_389290 [Sordaria brevicollis]